MNCQRTLRFVSLLLALGSLACAQAPEQQPLTDFSKLRDGDIVFIESNSPRAPAIKALTKFDITHCGIVFKEHGDWIVYEGAGRPGSYLDIGDWRDHEAGAGRVGDVYVRRLRDQGAIASILETLKRKAKELHDTRYDFGFAWQNRGPDGKEFIYCSELVWKVFHEIANVDLGTPHPLADYYLSAEAAEAQKVRDALAKYLNSEESKRRRDNQPYRAGELAISPAEVFRSEKLDPVTDTTP